MLNKSESKSYRIKLNKKRTPASIQADSLRAKAVSRKDIEFWIEIYKDYSARRFMYAAPLGTSNSLWKYLHFQQRAFTVWDQKERIGGFLLSTIAPFIGTFSIVIHQRYRGVGYGNKLMKLIEREAARIGYKTLRADVYADNPAAMGLLTKNGFREFVWYEKNL